MGSRRSTCFLDDLSRRTARLVCRVGNDHAILDPHTTARNHFLFSSSAPIHRSTPTSRDHRCLRVHSRNHHGEWDVMPRLARDLRSRSCSAIVSALQEQSEVRTCCRISLTIAMLVQGQSPLSVSYASSLLWDCHITLPESSWSSLELSERSAK